MNIRELCRTTSGPFLRPFAPNAQWQSAEVFIVGENPARPIGPDDCDYEQFMDSLTGDGELFSTLYAARGISKTRKRTNELRAGIAANVLLTNIYWTPTRKANELRTAEKDATLFRALMGHVKPRVIVTHGKPATMEMGVNIETPLAEQDWTIQIPGAPYETRVFALPHFSGRVVPKGFGFDMPRLAARVMDALAAQLVEAR